jgi:hypothetical protein
VAYAADHCGGRLTKEAIRAAEKEGAVCDICHKSGDRILSSDEHGSALLVDVYDKAGRELNDMQDLRDWLVSIKDQATKDGFVGFAFRKAKAPSTALSAESFVAHPSEETCTCHPEASACDCKELDPPAKEE